MIDKIDSNYRYEYPKVSRKNVTAADAYNTDYAKKGVLYEKNESKEQDIGVTLDLSQKKEESQKSHSENVKMEHASGLTLEQIKETIHSFLTFLKDTWKLIWEDAPTQETEEILPENRKIDGVIFNADMAEEASSAASTEQPADEMQIRMQNAIKSRNLEALTAMLTNNGKIKPARNSPLLTTYDRRGRIVKLDEAEKERILHGDKNFIKL